MEIIRKGNLGEGKRVRDFADMCFCKEPPEDKFETLLPKLYGEPEQTVEQHFLLENDGELKGLILPQALTWKVGGRELLTGHIGTVCVSPDYRERSAMRRLMTAAVEELQAAGCVLIALGGQRQRYEHYGFVPTGSKTEFLFYPENIKGEQADGYTLRPFESEDLEEVQKLFCKNGSHMEREKSRFADILRSWSAQPLVLWKGGNMCGYCTVAACQETAVAAELRLKDTGHLKPLLKCLFLRGFSEVKVKMAPEAAEYGAAGLLCEHYRITPSHNVRILRFAPLVETLLEQKRRRLGLAQGAITLLIQGHGCLEIRITAEGVKAWMSEEAAHGADMELTYEQAVHLLFSLLSPERERLFGRCPVAANWFPLPLYIEENDCI